MTIPLLTTATPQPTQEVQLLTEGPGYNANQPQPTLPIDTLVDIGTVNDYSVEEYNNIDTDSDEDVV